MVILLIVDLDHLVNKGVHLFFSPALMWIDHHSIEPTRIETTSTTRTTATARTTSPSLKLPFWTLSFGSTKKVHICNIGFHSVQKTHTWINKHHRFMKNKGFGHLRTTLFTIKASKHVGFEGQWDLMFFYTFCWDVETKTTFYAKLPLVKNN